MINELAGNASLDRFRAEYEKIHNALKDSNTSNQRLSNKCRELNAEIIANSSKVAQALKVGQDDQASIGQLKSEIEKAWLMLDSSNEKEQRARETVESLKFGIIIEI